MTRTAASPVARIVAAVVIGAFCHLTDITSATATDRLTAVDTSHDLQEASYTLDVKIKGVVAEVTFQQTITNRGRSAKEGRFEFDLPDDAAITSFSVQLANGKIARSTLIGAKSAITLAPDAQARLKANKMQPDIGVLRLIERDSPSMTRSPLARATYEMHLYPIAARRAVTVRVRWVAPLHYDDGRLSLRIPARGPSKALASTNVRLTLQPPTGATHLGPVYGAGRLLTAKLRRRKQFRFAAWNKTDLVIEAVPHFSKRSLKNAPALVLFDTTPITKNFGVAALTVLAPVMPGRGTVNYERVIIVADVSLSNRKSGLAATRALVSALLGAVPAKAKFELITFDREVTSVFGRLRSINQRTKATAMQALTRPRLRNGSDLGSALEKVSNTFDNSRLQRFPPAGISRGAGSDTLVVLLSDGVTPLELTPKRALDRIGRGVLRSAEVLSIAVVPDNVPTPNTGEGPLAALANRTGGGSIAIRHSEAATRAKTIARELGRPIPFRAVDIKVKGAALEGLGIQGKLRPGQGRSVFGWYHGKRPSKAVLVASVNGKAVSITARSDRARLGKVSLPLALSSASLVSFIPVAKRIAAKQQLHNYRDHTLMMAQGALLAAARKQPTVTRYSSLVALGLNDEFARDRLAFAKKWGPSMYFRVPPPPERNNPGTFAKYRERRPRKTTIAHGAVYSERYRRTGTLDKSIIGRLIQRYVFPKARACYESALRRAPTLRGRITLFVELARGEVQIANAVASTMVGPRVAKCLVKAAYTIQVPRVRQGADQETVSVVRYPFRFAPSKKGGVVSRGTPVKRTTSKKKVFNPHEPLPGLAN